MSSLFGSQKSGLILPGGVNEPMPLSDILSGTTYVTPQGRIYRLFGNEEELITLPEIPPLPSMLTAPKASAISLDEALEQIENFYTLPSDIKPGTNKPNAEKYISSASQSGTLSFPPPKKFISAEDLILEGKQTRLAPAVHRVVEHRVAEPRISDSKLRELPIRILPDSDAEPLIIPFAPRPAPLEPCNPEPASLKIVPETPVVPQFICRYRHRFSKFALYRKRWELTARRNRLNEFSARHYIPKPLPDFQWPLQLHSLMQTAENQICMLADHLLVQWNQGIKTICFNSIFSGDGCSTILLCAVKALLDRKYRILLIDANHRHIDLPQQLNLSKPEESCSRLQHLDDSLSFWAWQETFPHEENRIELDNIVKQNREEYDFILLDYGSITESSLTELQNFWNQCELDGMMLVTNTKRPEEMPVMLVAQRLRQHQIHVIGITENYV